MKIKFIIVLIIIPFIVKAQEIKQITSVEANKLIDSLDIEKTVIIDARDSLSFKNGHIKNALNIDAFKENAQEKLTKHLNKENIIIYCTFNRRCIKMIGILQNLNFKGVIYNMNEGINAWKQKGYEIVQ